MLLTLVDPGCLSAHGMLERERFGVTNVKSSRNVWKAGTRITTLDIGATDEQGCTVWKIPKHIIPYMACDVSC